ncbi:Crp/Fnr family transcriptional regulator [Myxococcota bacterium]|nr:Crp/Fnr family transcriptional regulator [Myxococcota bacterium]
MAGCPVKERGVELRTLCAECDGHARCGQFAYARGGLLCLEGDSADAVHAVIEGCLREVRTTSDGRAQPVRLIGPGELAGVEALTSSTYHATVEAVGRVIACRVSVAEVKEHLERHPELARAFLAEVTREMQVLRDSVLWIGAYSAEERVLALLRLLTRAQQPGAFVELPLNRFEMAEFLGLAHSTVSRIVRRLERKGVLEIRGRCIRLDDPDAR